MPFKRMPNRPVLIQQATELRKEGLTYAQIGKIVGVSAQSVCRWLNPIAHSDAARLRRSYRLRKGLVIQPNVTDDRWESRPPYYEFLRKWRLMMERNSDE